MGWFGGSTPKPMVLFSNAPWIEHLETYRQQLPASCSGSLVHRFEDPDTGKAKVRGGPDLKESQAYTPEFGAALANMFAANRSAWRRGHLSFDACSCRAQGRLCPTVDELLTAPHSDLIDDSWGDAELQALMRSLQCRALAVAPGILNDVIDVDAD